MEVCGDAGPCLTADLSSGTLERKAPSPQHPSNGARCTMMAKHVKLAAGGDRCNRLHKITRNGPASSRVAFDVERSQRCRSQGSVLRTRQCPCAVAESKPHLLAHKLLFQLLGGPLLSSGHGLTGLWILFARWRAVGQLLPVRDRQTSVENSLLALPDRTEASHRVIDFQLHHHALCDCRVPLSDHTKGVRPT